MKIAFVGKGGSGKSTVSSLFIKYLQRNKQRVIAIDADINVHLAMLLGCTIHPMTALSLPNNSLTIKEYLRGSNPRISNASAIVKSTPPGRGSRLLECDDSNPILASFATSIDHDGYLLHVGTYDKDGIGESCYHSNLAIFESLLSHTHLREHEWLVADMVAGTDAFAGTLHAQFDAIILVVEPTPEGVSVFEHYKELAEAAGVLDYVFALGNKIDDEEDFDYLHVRIGEKLVGALERQSYLKKSRQSGQPIDVDQVQGIEQIFDRITYLTKENKKIEAYRRSILHELHRKHAKADYILARHGDLSEQIDPDFSFED